jgi:hypothetical protein
MQEISSIELAHSDLLRAPKMRIRLAVRHGVDSRHLTRYLPQFMLGRNK